MVLAHTHRHITLMTGDPAMGERNTGLNHTAQSGYLRTKPHTGTWPMKEIRWTRSFFLENNPQIVNFLGGERCKPGPNQGAVQLVIYKRNKINIGCCGLNHRAGGLSARRPHGGGGAIPNGE
jgi:hypothetical protein